MGIVKAGIMNNKYVTLTIEEYFNVTKEPTGSNSQIVTKSLVKYLKNKKEQQAIAA